MYVLYKAGVSELRPAHMSCEVHFHIMYGPVQQKKLPLTLNI